MSNRKELQQRAKKLRCQSTKQENKLWYQFLRTYPVKFRRQKIIGRYIVDFYCQDAKLVIELDGSQHYTDDGLKNDIKRSIEIENYGIQVLRFTNLEVSIHFKEVCIMIDSMVKERISRYTSC